MSDIYVGDAFPSPAVMADFHAQRAAHRAAYAAHRRRAIGYVSGGSASVVEENTLRAFAERSGFELLAVVREAVGAMRTKPFARPGFINVRGAAENGRFGTLLVSQARILSSPDLPSAGAVGEVLEGCGVVIQSVSEPDVDTSTDAGKQALEMRSGLPVLA